MTFILTMKKKGNPLECIQPVDSIMEGQTEASKHDLEYFHIKGEGQAVVYSQGMMDPNIAQMIEDLTQAYEIDLEIHGLK